MNKGRKTGTIEERILDYMKEIEEIATDPAERWSMLKGMMIGRKGHSRRVADNYTKYLERKRAKDIAAGQEVR